jgi:hypothetical protein
VKNIETDAERALAEDALLPWSDGVTPLGKTKPGGDTDPPQEVSRKR